MTGIHFRPTSSSYFCHFHVEKLESSDYPAINKDIKGMRGRRQKDGKRCPNRKVGSAACAKSTKCGKFMQLWRLINVAFYVQWGVCSFAPSSGRVVACFLLACAWKHFTPTQFIHSFIRLFIHLSKLNCSLRWPENVLETKRQAP